MSKSLILVIIGSMAFFVYLGGNKFMKSLKTKIASVFMDAPLVATKALNYISDEKLKDLVTPTNYRAIQEQHEKAMSKLNFLVRWFS